MAECKVFYTDGCQGTYNIEQISEGKGGMVLIIKEGSGDQILISPYNVFGITIKEKN